MTSARRLSGLSAFLLLLTIVVAATTTPTAQVAGPTGLNATRSVNMVSGNSWPNGDPYLQRQNEPSVAVSTRNTQHLLAGANDYRTVDLPGISTGPETGDAWLGLFKSFDGGERWQSSLLPGYPQDTSAEGMASPLKGYQAGADAVVRPGTNGLLYFSGLAFNRGENGASSVFLSRFIDNNNKENGDPIKYLGTTVIDKSTGAEFIDKPWMAVDVPRQGAKFCKITQTDAPPAVVPLASVNRFRKATKATKARATILKAPKAYTQTIQAGMIYLAYSRIATVGTDITSRIMFTSSDDCGTTWTKPVQISAVEDKVNQGATIAVDPATGAVAVAWRQFGVTATSTDSIISVRSQAKGKFDAPVKVHKFNAKRPGDKLIKMIAEHRMGDGDDVSEIQPFDQGTAQDRFRTNAYPSIAFDDESRAYLAWTERGYGVARSSATEGDARVVVATSKFAAAWTSPRAVDVGGPGADRPGHQLMPSIAFAAGKLVIVYYDLREDVSQVFSPFVSEKDTVAARRRHTIDIRSAYALKGDVPVFGTSNKVSQYTMGSRPDSNVIEQLQYNPPNLPLFKLGTVPFMGDYIDLAPSPAFVQDKGTWKFNTVAQVAPVFHVVWTDNRDVRPPLNGNWADYTPVKVGGVPGTFDPSQPAPDCKVGQTGMRNQNIYSARLTFGLVTGSPGNAKPLDPSLPRGFVVFAQNTTTAVKSYRMTIAAQPAGGRASFTQTFVAGQLDPLLSVDVSVPAKSMVTRTVFVTSTDAHAQVPVDIQEISAPEMPILSDGLASRVILNPDISNPDISNPDISNPDISNPDISNAEVYNPDISNPDISNPDISNPDISNPDISNPDISNVVVANPDISNPDISNPDISNPDISNPDISNPDISNSNLTDSALTDVTWTIVNTGNTTTSFNVNLFLENAAAKLSGVKTQLVVHKSYATPVAAGCTLKQQTQMVLVANVPSPTFYAPGTATPFDPTNSEVTNTTVWLEPGGTSKITLRIIDPNPQDNITIDPVHDVTPIVTAEPKNTADIGTVVPPPSTAPPASTDVRLNFSIDGQPTNTILTRAITPTTAHAELNGGPAAGVQVTMAIANNPAGGHLSGTTTLLTDAYGNATFTDLSIDKVGVGYKLSASASAFGALPDLSAAFDITFAPVVATATGGTFVYDGQLHGGTCTVTGFNNVSLAGAISYSSPTAPVDAGTYTVTCSYSGDGYYGPASSSATITIGIASSSTIVTCADTTYTGLPQETCTASVTGAGGLTASAPVTYTNNVNAGTATGTATYAGDANHAGSTGSNTFTIAPMTPTATATGGAFTYDGQPHPGTCTMSDGLAGSLTYTPGGASAPVNAGDYIVNCDYAGDANHTAATATATLKITPAASSTAVTCANATYTGAPQETCTAAVTGAGGLNTSAPIVYANNVNAGTATGTATYAGDANHAGSTGSNTFTIAPMTPTATATGGAFTYDGQPHPGTCTMSDGLAGSLTYTPGGASAPVNVGDYIVNCDYAADANHTAATATATLKINPSSVTIASASPANGKPGDGFIVLRGANLPTDAAVVTSGASSANGFIYQSPSSPSRVFVRLPSLPLGAATIQLRNAAGTIVSNAFPLTLTAIQGTPVITAIYNSSANPLTTAAPAGSNILVSADGIDTTGAIVRFAQGALTWDVASSSAASNATIGLTAVTAVPMTVATGSISVSIRQGASAFSAPVTINVTAAPSAFTAWSASGPGSVTVNDDGTADGTPDFNYSVNIAGSWGTRTWEFRTTSPAAKTINLQWSWSGYHAFFQVTARLDVFVRHLGVDTIVATPVNGGPVNCCSSPSGGFSYNGSTNVVVQAGDTYGFKVSGSNFDSDARLQGTLAVTVTSPVPAPALFLAASGSGAFDQRADVGEYVVGRPVVEEDRRRFAAPRFHAVELR